MKLTEDTKLSTDFKTLALVILGVAIAVYGYFAIESRLTVLETEITIMNTDLLKASKQLTVDQEQYLLLEFTSSEFEKLKGIVEEKLPLIVGVDMQVQFLEERIIDLETLVDKLRNNGSHE
jgi:hypothetical protein